MGPPTPLVRPALELAWAVAREGEQRLPPIAAPGPMRPMVRFARLPGRALDAVRRVVDDDAAFRERVAAVADEAVIGRVPWLWLVRPEGWSDELASASAASEVRSQVETDRRADRAAARRLGVVEETLRRTEAELVETRAAGAALTAELGGLRREIEGAGRDRAAHAAAAEAHVEAERRAAAEEHRRIELEELLAGAERRLAASEAVSAQLGDQLEVASRALRAAGRARRSEDERRAATTSVLGQAVAEAALAAQDLGGALGRAAQALGHDVDDGPTTPADAGMPVPASAGDNEVGIEAGAGKRGPRTTAGGGPRRRPVPLPKAIFDDSPDAASWLVRRPGAVLLVDGYNITLSAWSGRDLVDQRHRLVTALAELSMRTGAEIEVVFDGAEDHVLPPRSRPARRAVRVTFSPPAVDADEVLIERVAQVPGSRPVIVATDDRRVRDECALAGANLLTTGQLVTLLGRSRDLGRP